MSEFDPNNPLQHKELRDVRDEGNFAYIGLFAALTIAVIVGIFIWNTSDRDSTTAMNTAPGVTTGAAPTTPAPPAPQPKNSTR